MNSNRLLMVHPGRILLEEFLAPKGISVWRLAKDIDIAARRVYEIVQGQRPITTDIAHRLAHYFGMSERYWLDLQTRYDGKREQLSMKEVLEKQAQRYAGSPEREGVVLRAVNPRRPVNRTLVVVDGGLGVKTRVETFQTKPKPKLS
jgi:addiction module HigA family antidote